MPSRTSRHGRTRRSARLGAALATGAAALVAAAPAVADAPMQLLAQGSSGPEVTQVQNALHIPATGEYNPGTTGAVRAFQTRDGLMIDGVVGPQTWDALFGITPRAAAPAAAPASAPAHAPSTAAPATASSTTTSTGGYSIPSSIVQCESGGNYSAVNSSSGAGGAYQILPSTWQAYGGQGLPQNAPPAEQNQIAGEIYAHQGASAWSC